MTGQNSPLPEVPAAEATTPTDDSSASAGAERSAVQVELETFLAEHQEFLDSLQSAMAPEQLERLREIAAGLPESLASSIRSPSGSLSGLALKRGRLLNAAMQLQARGNEIAEVSQAAGQLGHKQARQLATTRNRLRRLMKEIGWPKGAPLCQEMESLHNIDQSLIQLEQQNHAYQQKLVEDTAPLIDSLRKFLEEGQSNEAGQAWDKLQGIVSNLNGQYARQVKEGTAEFRPRISELRDWKNFAATEKKKELIEQMRHLIDSKMSAPDRSRQINRLHRDWKQLGRTSQNETLWEEFKTLSDQAYAPCKEYFKEHKQHMAENLERRNDICGQLESYLASLDRENVRIVDLKQVEKQAGEDWKRYAPVEQAKIKKLQKRFYGLLNEIRNLRRSAARDNGRHKQELVEQAKQLSALEDRQAAMAQAKALQSKWKTIGPSTFKEDKKYWDAFRSACDQLFSRQNEERGEQRAELAQAVSTCNDVLQALDSLFVSDDETFRESRKQFASLKGDFQNALGSRIKKERKPLLDKFNSITRRIESRFNTLPDRKTLEAQAALNEKARVCLDLEAALLEADEGSIPGQLLSDEIQARWQALPGCGKSELDKLMAMRFDRLRELKSKAELDRLVEQTELAARRQVIELEIKANIESPEADRQIRMEIQLRQLQDSFGRHGTVTPEENHRLAREFGLTFLCLGPLAAATREELQKRTDKAVARLGSVS